MIESTPLLIDVHALKNQVAKRIELQRHEYTMRQNKLRNAWLERLSRVYITEKIIEAGANGSHCATLIEETIDTEKTLSFLEEIYGQVKPSILAMIDTSTTCLYEDYHRGVFSINLYWGPWASCLSALNITPRLGLSLVGSIIICLIGSALLWLLHK